MVKNFSTHILPNHVKNRYKTPVKSGVFLAITNYESPALPLSYAAKSNDFNKLSIYSYTPNLFSRNFL